MPRCAALFASISLICGAAVARTEDREMPDFDAVNVESGIRATVEIGPRRPVRIEADDDVLPLIEMRVEDGALRVGFKPDANFRRERQVSLKIQTPHLRAVGASGGSVIRATFTRAE